MVQTPTLIHWALDAALLLSLLWLAWCLLRSPDLFKAVVLFIVFGMLMALTWARLAAPDLALAEAAIGAGLTGALLLAALRRIQQGQGMEIDAAAGADGALPGLRGPAVGVLALLSSALAAVLGWAVWSLPSDGPGLAEPVRQQLVHSGASNPVTAVLLNFRGYDTLLEVGVLLLALLCVRALGAPPHVPPLPAPGPVLLSFTRLIAPAMALVAAYLLWAGAHAPGGAFQGAAVLAAAAVLLLLSDVRVLRTQPRVLLRVLLVLGLLVFIAVAAGMLLAGGRLLEYPRASAALWLLLIEAAALISIALVLGLLFAAGRIAARGEGRP